MGKSGYRPIRSTWLIVLFSVLILACAETQEAGDGGSIQVTFDNQADWGTNIWVDGSASGWVEAGQSTTLWLGAGSHRVQYDDSNGQLGAPRELYLETGQTYTVTLTVQ